MISYQDFCNEWNGKQITRYGAECVAGVAEYESENGLPIVWEDAHSWINNPTMFSAYDWIVNNPNDPNQLPPQGAIIIWPLPNEHIAFFDHNLDNHQFMSFGQNSGGPTMHFQPHSWANVAGWYIPKQVVPSIPLYTITAIEPKQLHVKTNQYKWNLAQPDFQAVVTNPITNSGNGIDFTAVAILTRSDTGFAGYTYYLEDANTPHGWNSFDCQEVITTPMPIPYTPPAPPQVAKPAEKYTLFVTVMAFDSAADAASSINAKSTLPAGTYYVWGKDGKVYQLGIDNIHEPTGNWVNTLDNVAPKSVPVMPPLASPPITIPVMADNTWKSSRSWFYPDRNKFDLYELQSTVTLVDLDGRQPSHTLTEYKAEDANTSDNRHIKVHGIAYKNGVKYYLLHDPADTEWLSSYAIAAINLQTGRPNLLKYSELYSTTTTIKEKQAIHTIHISDRVIEAIARLPKVWDIIKKLRI